MTQSSERCRQIRTVQNPAAGACPSQLPSVQPPPGFSLLEVIVAIGLFAVGVVAVIGLFGAIAKSASGDEATAAAGLGAALRTHLQTRVSREGSLDGVTALLAPLSTADPPERNLLYANRDGTTIGGPGDPVWSGSDANKFFSIQLLPVQLAVVDGAVQPYMADIRWPAFVPRAGTSAALTPAAPKTQEHLYLPGVILR